MTVIQYMEAHYCLEFPYMARGLPLGLQKEFPWYCRQTLSVIKFCTSVVQIGKVNFFMLLFKQRDYDHAVYQKPCKQWPLHNRDPNYIVPYTLSSLNSAKCVLFQTGSPGSLPFQNCYLHQRKLPCDYKAERSWTTRDKHLRLEDPKMWILQRTTSREVLEGKKNWKLQKYAFNYVAYFKRSSLLP